MGRIPARQDQAARVRVHSVLIPRPNHPSGLVFVPDNPVAIRGFDPQDPRLSVCGRLPDLIIGLVSRPRILEAVGIHLRSDGSLNASDDGVAGHSAGIACGSKGDPNPAAAALYVVYAMPDDVREPVSRSEVGPVRLEQAHLMIWTPDEGPALRI